MGGVRSSVPVARRGTSRDINRQIALNLIRTRQPISRADLARLMGTGRGAVTLLVNQLIAEGRVFEGATGEAPRGRKPRFLYLDARRRCVVAIDLRPTRSFLMVTDIVGNPLVGMTSFPTERDPDRAIVDLAERVQDTLKRHPEAGRCEGVGIVVPGMVDPTGTRVLFAPRLRWHDVPFQQPLSALLGLPVVIENSGKACALAQAWTARSEAATTGDLVFVNVSDGLGRGGRDERAAAARTAQRGRRVRPHAARARRAALRVRRVRLLGGARLEPGDGLALPGARARARQADPDRDRRAQRRGRDLARAPGRRARARGARRHGALPGRGARRCRERGRPVAHLPERRDHARLGSAGARSCARRSTSARSRPAAATPRS